MEVLEEYNDKMCTVNSNRINFRKYNKPFRAQLLMEYVRWKNTEPVYKIKCVDGNVYMVYKSEIKIDEEKNEIHIKNTFENPEKLAIQSYDDLKKLLIESDKNVIQILINTYSKQLEKYEKNVLITSSLKLIITMMELAIELK